MKSDSVSVALLNLKLVMKSEKSVYKNIMDCIDGVWGGFSCDDKILNRFKYFFLVNTDQPIFEVTVLIRVYYTYWFVGTTHLYRVP